MDDSTSISAVPFNVNNAEEAVLADAAKYKKQVEQMIDLHDFSDDEEEDDCSESEDESNCNSKRSDQENSRRHSEQSNLTDYSQHSLDSQHSWREGSNEQCQHSYQTRTPGASEVPSDIEDGLRSEVQHVNGHSSFSGSPKHSGLQERSYVNGDVSDEKYPVNGYLSQAKIAELQEECRYFKHLYDSKCDELKQVKQSEQMCQNDAEQQKHIFEQKLELINVEKEGLLQHLQTVQTLVSNYESKNKDLLDKVSSLEGQIADAIDTKHEALAKLESSELTVHSLEKQLRELQRTESRSRVHDNNDRILEDLKVRHQKEVLQYKENIDDLQKQLSMKIQFANNLTEEYSEMQQSCQRILQEKNELLIEMEKIQGKYHLLLKNDTVEELNSLKVQVQRLQDENRTMHKQKEALKEDIKTLKAELRDSETLRKLPLPTKSNPNEDLSDGRQKELNLKQELENSLINVQNLRWENSDLKKLLKDSENEHAQMLERLKLYKQQIEESEDMTKKLKEATSNEKFLREHNEELTKKIKEMMQKHLEEKQKSVEQCREKYLELHENVLSKEKERFAAKAEEELREACSKYENEITSLQKRNASLSEKLCELKTQNVALQQGNQNLLRKLDEVPVHKDREEVEKELRADYEKQLKQMKEHFIKQKDEDVERCLKTEIERAQTDWANSKMVDIKNYVETTKQRLDEEFQKCLEKERNNFNQELRTEKRKLEDEFNQKLQNLMMQHDKEKSEQRAQLNQDLQSQWLKERALLKENYEKEAMHLQQQLEYKLSLAERELKYLREKLSSSSESQKEIEKIKDDHLQKQMLFNQEKAQLLSSEAALNENLKALVETEKRLRKKLLKYERHTAAIKKKHLEEVAHLQSQLSDLQKLCEEKQSQLREQFLKMGEKFRKTSTSCETQTEEDIVSKNIALSMETKFFKCLENISDEIRLYLIKSNTRKAERFQSALQLYHQQMNSKNLQDISNDIRSFTPTIIIPKASTRTVSSTSSRDTFASSQEFRNGRHTNSQDFHNGKFTTSTPGVFHSSNKKQVSSELITNKNLSPGKCNSSPNLSAHTIPKTVPSFSQNSDLFKNYFTSIYKNCTPAMDRGDVSSFPKKVAFSNGHSLPNGKDVELGDDSGDISYDFIPTNIRADVGGPGKFQNGGLFGTGNF
ncbi:hypothetical protein JTE90_024874 [Oedothorax gibbosus]|uniref:Uncharacterized protein n=1 Tax=Oedothorax gibbosus TaxID=931172 RepID=A0AAV6V2P0_9ARAC|nr:hypothetical protein JTE90_024874 [Oedothorax gibbosus]